MLLITANSAGKSKQGVMNDLLLFSLRLSAIIGSLKSAL